MSDNAQILLQLKEKAKSSIDQAQDKLHALSRDIWSFPELAYQESNAHDRLVDYFRQESGWEVEAHYKLDTAFRASWGPKSNQNGRLVRVGFLSEYDALPGIGHACGHNLIAEVGVAAAVGLRGALQDKPLSVPVQVVVLGTPAEEEGGGKIDLLKEGAFDGLDVVFMAHPSTQDAVYLPCVANHDVTVRYHGKASHASAYPWEGVNALDAAVLCYNNLSVLRQQLKPTWRLHGIIKHGGLKPNIIPAYTELEYYLRTPTRAELSLLKQKAEACFRAAAVATGCQVQIEFTKNIYSNMLRFSTLDQLYQANGTALGMDFVDEEVLANESGSTDFGNVTFEVPGIHPYFYIGSDALNHTEEYTEAAGAVKAQFYTLRMAKALAMTALDLLLSPEQLERVRLEFTQAKDKEEKENTLMKTTQTVGGDVAHC